MFPPYPTPGFMPDFTGYMLDTLGLDWYATYDFGAQPPHDALVTVIIITNKTLHVNRH